MVAVRPPVGLVAPKVTLDKKADVPVSRAALQAESELDPEFEKNLRAFMESCTPEERKQFTEDLTSTLMEQTMRRTPVIMPDGKKVSLWKFAEETERLKALDERGAGRDTKRQISRAAANAAIPSEKLRRGYYKMQLRPEEQSMLGLTLFGADYVSSPAPLVGKLFGGREDFAFGVYARPEVIRQLLSKRYAGKDPVEVLNTEKFYQDCISCARRAEMTLMVVPRRNLPMEACAKAYGDVMQKALLRQFPDATDSDKADVAQMVGEFKPELVQDADWVTKKGEVKKDTTFLFSTGPDGRLSCEVINYRQNKDKRTTFMGLWKNPKLHRALFDCFLGADALSETGRIEVANGFLYIANGFSFGHDPSNPNQYVLGGPQPTPANPVGQLTRDTAQFALQPVGKLLGGVSAKLSAWRNAQSRLATQ